MRPKYLPAMLVILCVAACNVQNATVPISSAPDATSSSDTVGEVCAIASELLVVDRSAVQASTSLGDLGCDDLDFVELIMELEDRYGISISDETAEKMLGGSDWQTGMNNVTMQKLADTVQILQE